MVAPYMPEEAIRDGIVTIYADDDLSIEKDVKLYNKYIGECRIQKKEAGYARGGFWAANPVLLFGITFVNVNTAFRRGALAWCVLGLFVAAFVYFAIMKQNFIFAAAVTPVLLLLDIMFLSLVILNALLAFLYERYDRPLRDHPTYPVFYEINIHYIKRDRPKNDPGTRLGL